MPDGVAAGGGLLDRYRQSGPLEVEIGCGKGRFIIRCAESLPDVNFLAIEWAKRYFRIALQRANRRELTNLRLVRANAVDVMRGGLSTASVRAIHVLFPDPWPKKRHHKRRLFQPEFLDLVSDLLEDAGCLNLATDHAGYFDFVNGLVRQRMELEPLPNFSLADRLPIAEVGHTNYEVKYRAAGRRIHQVSWTRRCRAAADEGWRASPGPTGGVARMS